MPLSKSHATPYSRQGCREGPRPVARLHRAVSAARTIAAAMALFAAMGLAPQGCKDEAQTPENLAVSGQAPQFTLPSAEGREVSLSQFRGKADVLLYFHMAYG